MCIILLTIRNPFAIVQSFHKTTWRVRKKPRVGHDPGQAQRAARPRRNAARTSQLPDAVSEPIVLAVDEREHSYRSAETQGYLRRQHYWFTELTGCRRASLNWWPGNRGTAWLTDSGIAP